MPYKDTSTGFRFFAMTADQLDDLHEHCPNITVRPSRSVRGKVVASLDLVEDQNYSWLAPFIKHRNIAGDEYGILVSISTDSDSEIVRVPQQAVELRRSVGGVIDFSFTVLSET